jgi:hypothetical protein
MATMACRPLAWRHFWWLPCWLTHAKPCIRTSAFQPPRVWAAHY